MHRFLFAAVGMMAVSTRAVAAPPYPGAWPSTPGGELSVSRVQGADPEAYFLNFPSKFISKDGRTLWLCYAANFAQDQNKTPLESMPPGGRYGMCLQEVKLQGP